MPTDPQLRQINDGASRPPLLPLTLKLPFGLDPVRWVPDRAQRQAAWRLHVELSTQLGTLPSRNPLGFDFEDLRSPRFALASLNRVMTATRRVLNEAGPEVARSSQSFGCIALSVVQRGIQPFVVRWHHRLLGYEALRPPGMDRMAHELLWPESRNFFAEFELRQQQLAQYVKMLGYMAGITERPVGVD